MIRRSRSRLAFRLAAPFLAVERGPRAGDMFVQASLLAVLQTTPFRRHFEGASGYPVSYPPHAIGSGRRLLRRHCR